MSKRVRGGLLLVVALVVAGVLATTVVSAHKPGRASSVSAGATTDAAQGTGAAGTSPAEAGATAHSPKGKAGAAIPGSKASAAPSPSPGTGATSTAPSGTPAAGNAAAGNAAAPGGSAPSPGTAAAPAAHSPSGSIPDAANDTVIDGTSDRLPMGQADITRATVDYNPGEIIFAVRVRQPVDPLKDPNWSGNGTFASWELDTNGDGTPDYDVEYLVDSNHLTGTVTRPGDPDPTAVVCDARAAEFSPANGYTLRVDPKCLGNPASFSYRVSLFYDTKPSDENSDVATDVAPDHGLATPVTKG